MNLFDLHNSMWYNGLAYNIDAWIAGGCKMMMAVKLAFSKLKNKILGG